MVNQITLTCHIFNNVGNIYLRTEERIIPIPSIFVPCVSPLGSFNIHSRYVDLDGSGNEDVYLEETISQIAAIIASSVSSIDASYLLFNYYNSESMKVSLLGKTSIDVHGDSISYGQNATLTSLSFAYLFATERGLPYNQFASPGQRPRYVAALVQSKVYNVSTKLILCMIGLNSINQLTYDGIKEIECCYEVVFLNGIFNTRTPGGSVDVIKSSGWSAYDANANGGYYPSAVLPGNSAIVSDSSPSRTLSWSFTGTGFGFQFICSNAVSNFGSFSVYIDGVFVKTFNSKEWYNNTDITGPHAFSMNNLSNTSHTVQIITAGDGIVALDYFCTLNGPSNSAGFIYQSIPKGTNIRSYAGYEYATQLIRRIAQRHYAMGYNIGFMNVDNYVLPAGYDTDGIHYNNNGHRLHANGLNQTIL